MDETSKTIPLLDLPRDKWHSLLSQVLQHSTLNEHGSTLLARKQCADVRPFDLDELPHAFNELATAVTDPVHAIETEALRVVVVLRLYVVVFDKSAGTTRAACLLDAGGPLAPDTRLPDAQVRLLNSPQGPDWTFQWLRNWCRRNGFACEESTQKRELRCVARRLNRMARQKLDLRAMRAKIASELHYDVTHWRRAVRLASAAHRVPNCFDYNDALRFANWLDLLEREAANLMVPWFELAREEEIDLDLEPKAALKKWVRATGASARAWRSLATSPSRVWMSRAQVAKCAAARHLAETALLIDRFETSVPVPLRIVSAATARLDHVVDQTKRLKGSRGGHYSSLLRAAKWAMENGAWPRFLEEFDAVDLWFDVTRPKLDKPQRRRGWQWLVRSARRWADQEQRRRLSQDLTVASLPSLRLGGYEFSAVRNSFELWDAGRQLRNCLGQQRMLGIVKDQHSLLIVATRESDRRVVAAIEVAPDERSSGLCVSRAHGFANGPIPAPVAALLDQVVGHFEVLRVCGRASQTTPDNPMRSAAAQMELALTKMVRPTNTDDPASTAAVATHALIEHLQISARRSVAERN